MRAAESIIRNPLPDVILFPTYARYETATGKWKVVVRGIAFHLVPYNLRHRMALWGLLRYMREQPGEESLSLFEERIRWFASVPGKSSSIVIRIGERLFPLRELSNARGQFSGTIELTQEEVDAVQAPRQGADGWLTIAAVRRQDPTVELSRCSVQLVAPQGTSVITDIDDTIKRTCVLDRKLMLVNTFLRAFEPIEGMAKALGGWAEEGLPIHYVSSSPWQLFGALKRFHGDEGFPEGSIHLRTFRLRDQMVRKMFFLPRGDKAPTIRNLLKTFPQRQFLLVGDSSERDPEIYGALARKYRGQIARIYIRSVPERPVDDQRKARSFRDLPPDSVALFDDPAEIRERVAAEFAPSAS
jgi:hypothetical protein